MDAHIVRAPSWTRAASNERRSSHGAFVDEGNDQRAWTLPLWWHSCGQELQERASVDAPAS